jgi:hypothetical protein
VRESSTTWRTSTRLLLACGLLAPASFWILGALTAASWSGYDWVAESISSLVHAPLGHLQTVAFLVGAVLNVGWAVGLSRIVGTTVPQRRLVRLLFLVQAGVLAAFAVLPTDPAGVSRSLIGTLHLATFAVYAFSMPVTLLVVARIFRRDPRWRGAATPTTVAATVMIVGSVLAPVALTGPLLSVLGLLERAYVLLPTAWQVGVAIAGIRMLGPSAPASPAAAAPSA